jgi:FMN phosphatase YigB (HAD superfamily)
MIKAVIFDIGGVFSRFEDRPNASAWEERLKLEPGMLGAHIFGGEHAEDAYTGRVLEDQHWLNVGKRLNLNEGQIRQMRQDLYRDFVWDLELLTFAKSLRPTRKTGVISAAFSNVRTEISGWVNENDFDTLVYTSEEGINKPNPEIYFRALERLQTPAEQSVFIDDRLENLEGARAVGMYGILFLSPEQVKRDLLNLF